MNASMSERRRQLKTLIIESCDKDVAAESIADDEALFGPQARLELDSLDALQISMALQRQFGVRLADSKELRRALRSVAELDRYLQQQEG